MNSLSIVIALWNESQALERLFYKINKFKKKFSFKLEIIFINDGSTDSTKDLIYKFKNNFEGKCKIISYLTNMGKGHALRKGVLLSSGDWVLTSDADLSVCLDDFLKWSKKELMPTKIYFGSRLLKTSKLQAKTSRKIIGNIFRLLVKILFLQNKSLSRIQDTQCGFKLYHKNYAKKIFLASVEKRFLQDIEIVLLADMYKIDIIEMPVTWIYGNKSSINFIFDPIIMLVGLFRLKFRF
jgi:dolichyl-phosphate beta-glucosyltransferase